MNKYHKWLETAKRRLSQDTLSGLFEPQIERDIQCHLYHTLFQTKSEIKGISNKQLVFSELLSPLTAEKYDLALVRKRKKAFEPRLIIEIKETKRAHLPADTILKRIRKDIDKLRRYPIALETKGETAILKYYKKPFILFFFRGACKTGISVRTQQEREKLQAKLDDIILNFEPSY